MSNFSADQLKGFSFSEDGKTVHIHLSQATDDVAPVVLSMTAAHVENFWQHLGSIVDSIRVANGGTVEPAPPVMAASWKVGGNSMAPGMTAIMFDAELPSQRIILLPDLTALQLADSIEQKVFAGLSVVDQRAMLKEVEQARGAKPRLIIPGKRG